MLINLLQILNEEIELTLKNIMIAIGQIEEICVGILSLVIIPVLFEVYLKIQLKKEV